jgi:hypothetical protein
METLGFQAQPSSQYPILESPAPLGRISDKPEVRLSSGTGAELSVVRERIDLLVEAFIDCQFSSASEHSLGELVQLSWYSRDLCEVLSPNQLVSFNTLGLSSRIFDGLHVGLWTNLSPKDQERSPFHPTQSGGAEQDFEWLMSNQNSLTNYRGGYVAILDKKVVGYGHTMKQAYDSAAKKHLPRRPLLAFVPEEAAQAY